MRLAGRKTQAWAAPVAAESNGDPGLRTRVLVTLPSAETSTSRMTLPLPRAFGGYGGTVTRGGPGSSGGATVSLQRGRGAR